MRCPICDQIIDHTQSRPASDSQSCPLCRAIYHDAIESQHGPQGVEAPAGNAAAADHPVILPKRMPGVEDAFNWY